MGIAKKQIGRSEPNVRFGSKADMCSAQAHVRFVPIADIGQCKLKQADAPQFPVGRRQK